MPSLSIDPRFKELGFAVHVGALDYDVSVRPAPPALTHSIEDGAEMRLQELLGEAAASDPVIANVRAAFKACGKDPSRYRPSSEALTRRVIAGKPLYQVNNVVDSGNLVSLMTGIPIGIYDTAKIDGDMQLTIGVKGDSYNGIGRGSINLEGLPVLKDDKGPFGTPFSDSARTAVTEDTTNIVIVLFGLNIDIAHVEAAAEIGDTLITRFCAPDQEAG
ncbi:B3/4 domain-containing protein [Kordiimonas lacus]|uniref:B3/B4 domain-containing protein (DNA/RNA-binding domain of Phe-tRNA-synthetase) n=1 Tax=Kordiimonas lacus TaxID=637679 RepID=A0A1G7E3U2_9PROT|nr:phenylalanine--tRNA ligase beta subunit-related protein [Kordiimonas lacus]SDE58331.1 B3/B4 domain-containing protein (DNA/RNA-binding domain of Phe-tRNA-synthetase) [Kordiimonas lacus]